MNSLLQSQLNDAHRQELLREAAAERLARNAQATIPPQERRSKHDYPPAPATNALLASATACVEHEQLQSEPVR